MEEIQEEIYLIDQEVKDNLSTPFNLPEHSKRIIKNCLFNIFNFISSNPQNSRIGIDYFGEISFIQLLIVHKDYFQPFNFNDPEIIDYILYLKNNYHLIWDEKEAKQKLKKLGLKIN